MKLHPPGILEEAQTITSGPRRRDYDSAMANHTRIAGAWNWYLQSRKDPAAPISALDAATMMVLLKVARNLHSPKRDNFVDMAGYTRCAAECAGFEPQSPQEEKSDAAHRVPTGEGA